MSRISERFEQLRNSGQMGLVAYITAGDPDLGATSEYVAALAEAGTDVIELGVPFSDPVADGPVIQRASERALKSGTTLARILQFVADAQSSVPIVLFSYLNPILRFGFPRFALEARQAGVDGVLVTDLTVEESGPFLEHVRMAELDTVFLAAPTSTGERLKRICEVSRGFIYAVSRTGVTGTREALSGQVLPLLERLRKVTSLPLAAGFGVTTPEHVAALVGRAEAAVVGSALVKVIEEKRTPDALRDLALVLKRGRTGRGFTAPL